MTRGTRGRCARSVAPARTARAVTRSPGDPGPLGFRAVPTLSRDPDLGAHTERGAEEDLAGARLLKIEFVGEVLCNPLGSHGVRLIRVRRRIPRAERDDLPFTLDD